MTDNNADIIFVQKRENEYNEVFEDVKTVVSLYDDFVRQLRLFTEKQDIRNIRPQGIQRTVLLRE